MTAIALVDGTQDYSLDAGNTNVRKLLRLRIVRTDTTPDEYRDLIVRDWLSPDLTPRSYTAIQSAAWEPVGTKIRLETAVSVPSGVTLTINGEYWKNPTKIGDAQLSTAFSFDDEFFPIFVDGLMWRLYKFVGDDRAGNIQTDRNGRQTYTGQLGVFMDGLYRMAQAEDYGQQGSEFPDSPIGESAGAGSAWIYGGV